MTVYDNLVTVAGSAFAGTTEADRDEFLRQQVYKINADDALWDTLTAETQTWFNNACDVQAKNGDNFAPPVPEGFPELGAVEVTPEAVETAGETTGTAEEAPAAEAAPAKPKRASRAKKPAASKTKTKAPSKSKGTKVSATPPADTTDEAPAAEAPKKTRAKKEKAPKQPKERAVPMADYVRDLILSDITLSLDEIMTTLEGKGIAMKRSSAHVVYLNTQQAITAILRNGKVQTKDSNGKLKTIITTS